MKVLVIPDCHLKPHMFYDADLLMQAGAAQLAVSLMDIPDDWNRQYDLELYRDTFDAAIHFAKKYPSTLWSYGNHDLSYIWNKEESGYSAAAAYIVREKLKELKSVLPSEKQLQYIHLVDHVAFCHGGILDSFVKKVVDQRIYNDVFAVIEEINQLSEYWMWDNESPLWHRPQYSKGKMYQSENLLQVVGHTPVETLQREGNVLSCDVFSTYRDGNCIGTQEFLVLDTVTWTYQGIKREIE